MTHTHQEGAFRYHNDLGLVMVGGKYGGTKVTATLDGQTFQVKWLIQSNLKYQSLGSQAISQPKSDKMLREYTEFFVQYRILSLSLGMGIIGENCIDRRGTRSVN